MKTKADLLAHITALTESGALEWNDLTTDEEGHLPTPGVEHYGSALGRLAPCVHRDRLIVYSDRHTTLIWGTSLYELVDGMQPLPEWAQKVGQ